MSSDRALIIITTDLRGYVAPCGCTSEPLGGIARFAEMVEEKKRAYREPLIVTAGDFLFEAGKASGPALQQEEDKARLVAAIYRDLGVAAQTPGPDDLEHLSGAFAKALPNPWLRSGEWRVKESGGMRVALLGLGPDAIDAAKAREVMPKAEVAIALSAFGWQENRKLASALPFLDVIVSSGGGAPHPPARIGETLLLDAGEQGQHAGLLEIVKGEGARFQYYDGQKHELVQLKKQLAAMEREIVALPKGGDPAARALRITRRDELFAEVSALENKAPTPPKEKHLIYSLATFNKRSPELARVAQQVKAYNQTLCALSAKATENLECPPLPAGSPRYLGTEACGACHEGALAVWKGSKHAHAVKTLEDAGKYCDLGCIGCHTTGFNAPGGFCSPQKVGALKEVGCEMCHGPGSLHVEKGGAKTGVGPNFKRSPGAETCLQCHTQEHSDLFDFATYRPRILGPGHGLAK